MNRAFLIVFTILISLNAEGQKIVKKIEAEINRAQVESHIRFLAADEMRGRMTGTNENEITARYVAEQLRSFGVTPVTGQQSFIQEVPLMKNIPPTMAKVTLGDSTWMLWEDLIFFNKQNETFTAPLVYANYGLEEDIEDLDLEGKLVVVKAGTPEVDNPRAFFQLSPQKAARVREKGAIGLFELYRSQALPWSLLQNYLSGPRFSLNTGMGEAYPLAWVQDGKGEWLKFFEANSALEVTYEMSGADQEVIETPNVVGWLEGSDAELKDEYLIISAHIDHVGVKNLGMEDSIFNGARDNAIGTTALLTTAEFLGRNRPSRSVLFLGCNAEEVGLLGSRYYAENPFMPLENAIFNFNNDGAGYNDTTKMTIIGLERTNGANMLMEAASKFGLEAIQDPVPEQNLFDRSDNVSFASKGIPAINASVGITAFDDVITKYYHQPADEIGSLNFNYLMKFYKAYVYATWQILHTDERLFWVEGDKYEAVGKKLYGTE